MQDGLRVQGPGFALAQSSPLHDNRVKPRFKRHGQHQLMQDGLSAQGLSFAWAQSPPLQGSRVQHRISHAWFRIRYIW